MLLFCSYGVKRSRTTFSARGKVHRDGVGLFVISDAKGVPLA
jgi:hypothetical protein